MEATVQSRQVKSSQVKLRLVKYVRKASVRLSVVYLTAVSFMQGCDRLMETSNMVGNY